MEKTDKGRLKIWEKPKDNKFYAIGADIAEGIEGGDYSAAFVIDTEGNQVASWFGHCDPDIFGDILCRIGDYYNNALLAPEINNHGIATMNKIKERGYNNIYMRQVKEERSDHYTKKMGWHTNKKTKPEMLDEFVAAFRDDTILIKDENLLTEMSELFIDENGNVDISGKDRVAAVAIALQALKQVPREIYKPYVPNEGKKKYKNLIERNLNRNKHESYYE
jgi:hypothetical protein